jgi:hypothetical protein
MLLYSPFKKLVFASVATAVTAVHGSLLIVVALLLGGQRYSFEFLHVGQIVSSEFLLLTDKQTIIVLYYMKYPYPWHCVYY